MLGFKTFAIKTLVLAHSVLTFAMYEDVGITLRVKEVHTSKKS